MRIFDIVALLPRPLKDPAERVLCALHVLRGKPLGYKIRVEDGGFNIIEPHSWLVKCTVIGASIGIRVPKDPRR